MKRKIVAIGVVLLAIGIVAIIFSLWQIPFQEQESYDIPQSMNLVSESFVVPTTGDVHRTANLASGDLVHIYFECTSGGGLDVNFYVFDELNYLKWKAEETYSPETSISRTTTYNLDFNVPSNGTYYFVWDNSFSVITRKGVTATITKNWDEIAYRDVTVYHTVIPSEYSSLAEYLGIALVLVGIAAIIWGYLAKEMTDQA